MADEAGRRDRYSQVIASVLMITSTSNSQPPTSKTCGSNQLGERRGATSSCIDFHPPLSTPGALGIGRCVESGSSYPCRRRTHCAARRREAARSRRIVNATHHECALRATRRHDVATMRLRRDRVQRDAADGARAAASHVSSSFLPSLSRSSLALRQAKAVRLGLPTR
jgi:hypothetical protein